MDERGYFLRITPDNQELTLKDIEQLIKSFNGRYIISVEEATKRHYHIVLYAKITAETLRARIKKNLLCQVYISGKEIQDKVKAIAYTIKDGNYVFNGLDAFDLMKAKQVSHQKLSFDKEIDKIEYYDDRSLVEDVLALYQKYNRKVDKRHLLNLLRTIKLKQSGEYKEQFIKNILFEL